LLVILNRMRNKLVIVTLVLVALGAVYYFFFSGKPLVISTDMTISGNYIVGAGKTAMIRNGATLTVTGNVTIDGLLTCENGPVTIIVGGSFSSSGRVDCRRENEGETAIAIAAKRFSFAHGSAVYSVGNIFLTGERSKLPKNADAIKQLYDEAAEDSGRGGGARLGPFVYAMPTENIASLLRGVGIALNESAYMDTRTLVAGTAFAAGSFDEGDGSVFSGTWEMNHAGKRTLMSIDLGDDDTIDFSGLILKGADGKDGNGDTEKNCHARGEDGGNGMRLRVSAKTISVEELTLELGNGGAGGNASTPAKCDDALARAGAGGTTGNLKFIAGESININRLSIMPGKGGEGGNASASSADGVNGCPAGSGKDATAIGGAGGPNGKRLAATGAVTNVDRIEITRIIGGEGGEASAKAGKGGSGNACGCKGGRGGDATANAGHGGDASIGIPRKTGEAHGGDGARVEAIGGEGGAGGSCADESAGGEGGIGGVGKATGGEGGRGTTANGTNGVVRNASGGKGGAGGDGCPAGKGGNGGTGAPLGRWGTDGMDLCAH
jgi:hypothetical protein